MTGYHRRPAPGASAIPRRPQPRLPRPRRQAIGASANNRPGWFSRPAGVPPGQCGHSSDSRSRCKASGLPGEGTPRHIRLISTYAHGGPRPACAPGGTGIASLGPPRGRRAASTPAARRHRRLRSQPSSSARRHGHRTGPHACQTPVPPLGSRPVAPDRSAALPTRVDAPAPASEGQLGQRTRRHRTQMGVTCSACGPF